MTARERYRVRYEQALAAHLEGGERVLAVTEARRPRGPAPQRPPEPPRPSGTPARDTTAGTAIRAAELVASGADFGAGLGSTNAPFRWLARLIWGRAADGAVDSIGASFAQAVPSDQPVLPSGLHAVVVTDRRLLVFRTDRHKRVEVPLAEPVRAEELTLLWSVSRDRIAYAVARRHRLHHARLRVGFHDGSWLELTGPRAMRRSGAAELAVALGSADHA